MKKAVWTIFITLSTDENPQKHFCLDGEFSLCKYQRTVWKNEKPPSHTPTIPTEIAPFVKTVFEKLSDDSLMQRCVLGATQNQNESFNSLIWSRCPKTEFCSLTIVETAVNMAVMVFNSGMKPFCDSFPVHGTRLQPKHTPISP